MAVDPTVQQVLAQNALMADALYDLAQMEAQRQAAGVILTPLELTCIQDLKTKVNALNPAKFTF